MPCEVRQISSVLHLALLLSHVSADEYDRSISPPNFGYGSVSSSPRMTSACCRVSVSSSEVFSHRIYLPGYPSIARQNHSLSDRGYLHSLNAQHSSEIFLKLSLKYRCWTGNPKNHFVSTLMPHYLFPDVCGMYHTCHDFIP